MLNDTIVVTNQARFLMLQGPVGPCFQLLRNALIEAGHAVLKINLWGGDLLDYPSGVSFRGPANLWPGWIAERAREFRATDVILFGDQRPAHREALQILKPLGLRIHVLEEGYLRPDWVTLDRNGANANSGWLQPGRRTEVRSRGKIKKPKQIGPWMRSAAKHAFWHYTAGLLLHPLYQHHRHHRPLAPLSEGLMWVGRWASGPWRRKQSKEALAEALRQQRPLWILPLQLEGDAQLAVHGPDGGLWHMVENIMQCFTQTKHEVGDLIVKAHPLDPQTHISKTKCIALASQYKLMGRVHFISEGPMRPLLMRAKGLICANSTAGLEAVLQGIPVKAFGKAFWNQEGLTHQGSLEQFLLSATAPQTTCARKLQRSIIEQTQLNGSFYSKKGLELLIPQLAARLIEGRDVKMHQRHIAPAKPHRIPAQVEVSWSTGSKPVAGGVR